MQLWKLKAWPYDLFFIDSALLSGSFPQGIVLICVKEQIPVPLQVLFSEQNTSPTASQGAESEPDFKINDSSPWQKPN